VPRWRNGGRRANAALMQWCGSVATPSRLAWQWWTYSRTVTSLSSTSSFSSSHSLTPPRSSHHRWPSPSDSGPKYVDLGWEKWGVDPCALGKVFLYFFPSFTVALCRSKEILRTMCGSRTGGCSLLGVMSD
jgi:hypothetical protein